MSFSFSSMIRLLVVLGVSATLLAIGVSRLVPPRPPGGSFGRHELQSSTTFSSRRTGSRAGSTRRRARWSCRPVSRRRHLRGGQLVALGRRVRASSGGGALVEPDLAGTETVCHDFGLARYSFPDGRMLNQVPADIVPVGSALLDARDSSPDRVRCGRRPVVPLRVRAGRPARWAVGADHPVDSRPAALTWRCPQARGGECLISDVPGPPIPGWAAACSPSMRLNESRRLGASVLQDPALVAQAESSGHRRSSRLAPLVPRLDSARAPSHRRTVAHLWRLWPTARSVSLTLASSTRSRTGRSAWRR